MVHKKGTMCKTCTPGSAISKQAKKEEEKVYKLLFEEKEKSNSTILTIDREVHTSYSCIDAGTEKKFARLDFVLELPTHRVILEVDEHQHSTSSYNVRCDINRMLDVMAKMCLKNERPTRWIRYNPHGFTKDKVKKTVTPKKRHAALLEMIARVPDGHRNTELAYMYYDVDAAEKLLLFQDPDYDSKFKTLVTDIVIN